MRKVYSFLAVSVFGIFVGSQITEGALLVPYWESLSSSEFYSYYSEFGPSIGKFYTILTIVAALIPIILLGYCYVTKSVGLKYAAMSSFFAVLFVACFYIYFKGANEQFYNGAMTDMELSNVLKTWKTWHWSRVVIEILSLLFLILSLKKLNYSK